MCVIESTMKCTTIIVKQDQAPLFAKLLFAVLAIFSVGAIADDAVTASDIDALIEQLGLQESKTPVAHLPGWRRPARVVVRADSERIEWLKEAAPGVELVSAMSQQDAVLAVPEADAIIGFCSAEIIHVGRKLRWIQLPYAGVESCVAIKEFRGRNILLTNAQRVYGPEIAEHVLAMMLAFSRGLNTHLLEQRSGRWVRDRLPEERYWELTGKTILIVGLGGIGTEVARRAHALGMRVVATRISSRKGPEFVDYVGLADELMTLTPSADVVVNATPLTSATTDLFDAEYFASMKPQAYFINVGRGRSVATQDLVAALREGAIAGAGLDVTEPEPLPPEHPLWRLPNVIITPHVAAISDLRVERLWRVMRENLRRYVAGERMLSVVNVRRGY